MPIKTKGWTEASRRAAAERCRKNKPSTRSTGPKSTTGKAAASANSMKHGLCTAEVRQIMAFLRAQKNFLNRLS